MQNPTEKKLKLVCSASYNGILNAKMDPRHV